jgi:uncharacterized protein (DUF433 family)
MIRKPADNLVSTTRINGTTATTRDQSHCASRSAGDRTNPNPKSRGRRSRAARQTGYDAFAAEILREVDVQGTLETLLAEVVVKAAWDVKHGRGHAGTLLKAVDTLDRIRRRRVARTSSRIDEPAPEPEPLFDPERAARLAPVRSDLERPESFPPSDPSASEESSDSVDTRWRERLLLDPEVSEVSPVIRGTWISVSHVVALVVDGWSWADILRAHPELIEDDIRACLAWTVEQEGAFEVSPTRVDRSKPERA